MHVIDVSMAPWGKKPKDITKASRSGTDCMCLHRSQASSQPGASTWLLVASQTTVGGWGGPIQKVSLPSSLVFIIPRAMGISPRLLYTYLAMKECWSQSCLSPITTIWSPVLFLSVAHTLFHFFYLSHLSIMYHCSGFGFYLAILHPSPLVLPPMLRQCFICIWSFSNGKMIVNVLLN